MEITHEEFQDALKIVQKYSEQIKNKHEYVVKKCDEISDFAKCNRDTKLWDVPCSVRLLNALKGNDDRLGIDLDMNATIGDLEGISIDSFKKCRHVGAKSIQELKEICFYADVKLNYSH
jgi:hypothetical protein